METKTIVRIGNHIAEWTQLGWRSEDAHTATLCAFSAHAEVPLRWHPNRERSYAEQLVAVCLARNMDAEIISIGGREANFTDPNYPDAKF
jgi:hypothetical protein